MADFRTPLARARGLGSAKTGSGHFIAQRVSALALMVLAPLFIWSIASLPDASYESARAWIGSPLGAILTLLTLTATFYHMRLGLQVVVEDYIHKSLIKNLLLSLNTLIVAALWISVLYAVLAIAS